MQYMLAIRKVSSVELVLLKPPLYSKKKKKYYRARSIHVKKSRRKREKSRKCHKDTTIIN